MAGETDYPPQQAIAQDTFVQHKVAAARKSVQAGRGRCNDDVETAFGERRARVMAAEAGFPGDDPFVSLKDIG